MYTAGEAFLEAVHRAYLRRNSWDVFEIAVKTFQSSFSKSVEMSASLPFDTNHSNALLTSLTVTKLEIDSRTGFMNPRVHICFVLKVNQFACVNKNCDMFKKLLFYSLLVNSRGFLEVISFCAMLTITALPVFRLKPLTLYILWLIVLIGAAPPPPPPLLPNHSKLQIKLKNYQSYPTDFR